MSVGTDNVVKTYLRNVIRKFKFEELENAVLPVFPETSWDYVRSRLIKHHQNFTTLNVAAIIEEVISDTKLEKGELRQRLFKLELIDISRHTRRIWYAYSVSGSSHGDTHLGTIEFKQSIKEKLTALNKTKVDVDTVIFNGIMYISIKNVQTNSRKTTANYFAFFLGQKYLFSSKKNGSKHFLNAITHSMGYAKSRSLELKGKDLMSLIKLLRLRKQGVLNPANMINEPIYRDAEPVIKSTGIDYAQEKQRMNFAEKCFGKSPPTLDILVVKGPNCIIADREIAEKLSNSNVQVGWEFRSRNVAKFLTTLAERGVLLSPLPSYISNLMSIGRNILTLEEE